MAGQLCGRCGASLTDSGCDCPPTAPSGFGDARDQDAPTAIIPVIGAPELVRPYITPTELVAPQDPEDGPGVAYESYAVPGIDAPHMVRSSRARVLAGQLVTAGDRPYPAVATDLGPGERANRSRNTRTRNSRSGGSRGRRAVLIAAGALAVAGLGTAAALVPGLLKGSDSDRAQPLPGVTVALPTAAPASSPPGATGSSAPAAAVRTASTASASATPSTSPSAARTSSAPNASASGAPRSSSPAGAPPSTAVPARTTPTPTATTPPPAPGTLQLGDQGAAVATLQIELRVLRIDRELDASGIYDSRTEQDVSTFQVRYGVRGDPDGVFGPNSQAKMNQLFGQHHHH